MKQEVGHILFFTSHVCFSEGIGYSMFSHGNVSRALEMKSSPPLNLGAEGRRMDTPPGTRSNLTNVRDVRYRQD